MAKTALHLSIVATIFTLQAGAAELSVIPGDLPLWARQMPAFFYADMGEKDQAVLIIEDVMKNYKHLPPDELNFMYYFIKDRLKMLVPEELKGELQH